MRPTAGGPCPVSANGFLRSAARGALAPFTERGWQYGLGRCARLEVREVDDE
eukprot:CAMPEP_0197936950 /NCGR_PEP_ID=MMETSP1439-20131203/115772_1 /TAXON_ID=66791 /ORGANISM="Gonyaulax spinifera, Strain CCMP409" /LENGTH=51 /DNA_ID=CAMNT_0043559947 /DNA_START=1 /DNA_END=156 /DNA_ORIENTATION=+